MKQQTKNIIISVVGIALMISLVIAGFRINAEMHQRTVQLGIRYEDALKIAAVQNQSLEQVLADFKALGITTLFVKENTVLAEQEGVLTSDVAQGYVEVKNGNDVLEGDPQSTYVISENEEAIQRINDHLSRKGVATSLNVDKIPYVLTIPSEEVEALTTIGTGFIQADLQRAADLGYSISPEVRTWQETISDSITWEIEQIRQIPSLSYIYFEDEMIPGYDDPEMIELIKEMGLGFTEFYAPTQKGFDTLANLTKDEAGRYQLVRRFTDEKVKNISTPDPVARYELALTERGIRAFTFVLPNEADEIKAIQQYRNDIVRFKEQIEEKGYRVSGEKMAYTYLETPKWMTALIGLGTLAVFLLLMSELKLQVLGIIVTGIVAVAYSIGLIAYEGLTLQCMALFTTIVFPTYGIVNEVRETNVPSYKTACIGFFKVTGITFVGCMFVVGLLSRANYALGIDGFRGVKVAHLMPLLIVGGVFLYSYRKTIKEEIKQLLDTKCRFLPILLIVVLVGIGGIFFIYITRTGNGEISAFEKWIRQTLDMLLGVRPRTKEFLIGHPLLIGLLYFGYKNMYWPVLILATIGQISLMNTYAHIHTPLVVSLIRSAYGIGIGIVIGIILIQVVKFIFKVINKWIIKQE